MRYHRLENKAPTLRHAAASEVSSAERFRIALVLARECVTVDFTDKKKMKKTRLNR